MKQSSGSTSHVYAIGRGSIIAALQEGLEAFSPAVALHLGGSDASGRVDEGSDVDACLTVEDDAVEGAFDAAEEALGRLGPIEHRFRLPEPTWHGHSQCFYLLQGADPRHMVDLVVMKRSEPDRFLETERHGAPVILFDRGEVVQPAPLNRAALRKRMSDQLDQLEARSILFQPLVGKALDRGHVAEAMHFYVAFAWRPLVDLLRMIHCPDRFDFGPRYLDRDLPAEERMTVERLALAESPECLRAHHAEIAHRMPGLLAAARQRVARDGSDRGVATTGD